MSTIHDMHAQRFGGEDTETIRVECMERAAPAMLEALTETSADLRRLLEFLGGDPNEFVGEYETLEKADAAIAEAEGRDE